MESYYNKKKFIKWRKKLDANVKIVYYKAKEKIFLDHRFYNIVQL